MNWKPFKLNLYLIEHSTKAKIKLFAFLEIKYLFGINACNPFLKHGQGQQKIGKVS